MSGTLGSDHDNINVLGRNDAAEVNVEAVCKCQSLALCQVGSDLLLVNCSLLLIGDKDHDDVASLSSISNAHYLQTCCFCLSCALGTLVKTDNNVYAAVLQVESVCMTLRAVADDSNGLAVQSVQVTVLLIENLVHFNFLQFIMD